jgi:transposase
VPSDRDENPVRVFKTFTEDLLKLADWLVACRVTTVVMESTGVYFALSSALIGRVQVAPALG